MARELVVIDVSAIPELAQLVEEVRSTGTPRLLRRNGEDVAVLVPAALPVSPTSVQTSSADGMTTFTLESAYQSIPALPELLNDADMIRIAKEERAERVARKLRAP